MNQKTLRFTVSRIPGETSSNHTHRQRALNVESSPGKVCPEKLFADLLKRQARRVMADITECPPDTLPAHLARLHALREICKHAVHHGIIPLAEMRRSDRQLLYAYTVADFLACLDIRWFVGCYVQTRRFAVKDGWFRVAEYLEGFLSVRRDIEARKGGAR